MRVGIDTRSLQSHHRYRGIGVYVDALIKNLAKIDHKNEYVLFVGDTVPIPYSKLPEQYKYQFVAVENMPSNLMQRLNATYRPLPWSTDKWQLDVFLQPDIANGIPTGSAKKVSVAYDLIPVLFKEQYFPRRKPGKAWLVQKLLQRAYFRQLKKYKSLDCAISISESTKKDLLRFDSKLPSSRVEVIYLGVRQNASAANMAAGGNKMNKPYFLYVGSCDYRKNVIDIVRAFNLFRESGRECSLILVGRDFLDAMPASLHKEINLSPFKNEIKLAGFVEESELRSLYRKASGFLFPSLYEGFGMPPLEAMAAFCPVISYKNSSLPEVLDDAAVWCNSPREMADAMIKLLNEPPLREKLIKNGAKQANKFSWETTARKTLDLFERIHG